MKYWKGAREKTSCCLFIDHTNAQGGFLCCSIAIYLFIYVTFPACVTFFRRGVHRKKFFFSVCFLRRAISLLVQAPATQASERLGKMSAKREGPCFLPVLRAHCIFKQGDVWVQGSILFIWRLLARTFRKIQICYWRNGTLLASALGSPKSSLQRKEKRLKMQRNKFSIVTSGFFLIRFTEKTVCHAEHFIYSTFQVYSVFRSISFQYSQTDGEFK